ncbi:aminoglycoside phosphotransferase family protein [Thiohalomonas denitrificans]|uniref:aminoglycoside phosphotransferase family protein n=1 Tax=Thiohalomonas denitrificans TaxID=415747 RepID=UPI0026F3798B|nr:phosphotransferase [Thiohalomonas denitrificans]
MPKRVEQLTRWLRHDVGLPSFELTPASADASFRRYFRIVFNGESRIVMDAPPGKEDVRPFVRIARWLRSAGLNVPAIEEENAEEGFLLIGDLGGRQYLAELDDDSVDRLYGDALGALVVLQTCGPGPKELPVYDRELLLREMELFRDWFLGCHLRLDLTESEQRMLDESFERLIAAALEQPQVPVHRDFHSRNLMVAPHNPGILDFQDAVVGPVSYDLVSLLRDAYIEWPRERVEAWVRGYHDLLLDSGILRRPGEQAFLRWFDLMGAQRHLKVLGIFARLHHRDGKAAYLDDMPLTLRYLLDESSRYPELMELHGFLQERVAPFFQRG